MTTYAYKVPTGKDDSPDANGNHTSTVNVLHSAERAADFPGCTRLARMSCPRCHNIPAMSVYGGWDAATERFSDIRDHGPKGCGHADCELCAKYANGWCQTCKAYTRPESL
jgi:hypothetical protein